jgi:DNA topoisomerase-6 subunit B
VNILGEQKKIGEYSEEKKTEKENPEEPKRRAHAEDLAKKQREISVAEFFEKNRHLLGFDNKRKALLTAIKEAVDNSLDACEEAGILPELNVEIIDLTDKSGQGDKFRVIIEDNGPGIIKQQIPKIFAKLLYGSKFHSMKQSRGQQGIGISAAALYGQLTTGKPIAIISKIAPDKPAHYYELHIDTVNNKPEIVKEEEKEWKKEHGTKVEIDLEGTYQKGGQSVDEYLLNTAIVNPHMTLIYTNPKAEQRIFPRATNELPPEPKEIKPHPYGIEIGMLMKMMANTECKTLQQFFTTEFSRVGAGTAKEICEKAKIEPRAKPHEIDRIHAEKLMEAIKDTKIISPPTNCLSPIGSELLEKGLKKEINAEFYCSVSRPPDVYRGNPFIIEAALAYGGELDKERQITILRFANRVPLLYQQGACAITKSIMLTNWRAYGLSQSQNSIPAGPVAVVVHMSSVWVPFTSEAKEALAHYPEIIKEIRLALQECGRQLGSYVNKKRRVGAELKKRSYIEKYIPHVAEALIELLALKKEEQPKIEAKLKEILEKTRGTVDDLEFDPTKNIEYDAELAKIKQKVEQEMKEEDGEKEYKEKEEEEEGDL